MGRYNEQDVTKRLERFNNEDYISDANKELITEFINYLRAEDGVGPTREHKYIYLFDTMFREFIDFDLETATRRDMRKAVGKMKASDLSEWTVYDLKVAVKRMIRTIWETEDERPDNLQKILKARFMRRYTAPDRKHDIESLEPDEILAMIEAASNPRDKCLIFFMFETGVRIGELTQITIEDVELEQKYAMVTSPTLKNDKGPRTLALTDCIGLLQNWMDQHPDRDNDKAKLFVNISTGKGGKRGEPMSSTNIARVLRTAAKDAGVDKRITPHVMRHSSASYHGRTWGVSRMMHWFGWESPATAQTYLHENEERMKEERLAEKGIKPKEESDPLQRKTCGRCSETWPPTMKYCGHCSMALDKDAAEDAKNVEESGRDLTRARMDGYSVDELVEMGHSGESNRL